MATQTDPLPDTCHSCAQFHFLISTKGPAIAAAGVAGETRWVRALKPFRPSKLRRAANALKRAPNCRAFGRAFGALASDATPATSRGQNDMLSQSLRHPSCRAPALFAAARGQLSQELTA